MLPAQDAALQDALALICNSSHRAPAAVAVKALVFQPSCIGAIPGLQKDYCGDSA